MITEGEKKALKACQEALVCVAIGGLWNWRQDGCAIPDFDDIAWVERSVTIVPDSDVWARLDLIKAVYALGAELEGRGANVEVLILPHDSGKAGLDDYLVAHSLSEFHKLKRIPLKHKTFSKAREWHKEWVKEKASPKPAIDATKLLDNIQTVEHIRPAQDWVNGLLWFGIPAHEDVLLVNSERKIIRADELPDGLKIDNRGFNLCRFSKEGVNRFLDGESVNGKALAAELCDYFGRYLIIQDQRIFLLLSLWTMGTYAYRLFRVFPYLSLRSPTKECGKSRSEDLLSVICFNAGSRETSPTEAVLFRGPAKNGGTVLLDEIEGLKSDRDRHGNLLSVLCSGFERGGAVSRLEKRGEKYVDITYPTYCPRVLAGIKHLADTLEGRSITVFMERKLRDDKVDRFSRTLVFKQMQEVRDNLYIWALTHAHDVAKVYNDQIGQFKEMNRLGDRERDLWEPLVSIALICDAETGETLDLTKEICGLANDLSKLRAEVDTADVTQILEVMEGVLNGKTELWITPTELMNQFKANTYFDWLKSPRRLATLLAPLGWSTGGITSRHPETGKPAKHYVIRLKDIEDRKRRYGSGQ
jgi:hypothetical protein